MRCSPSCDPPRRNMRHRRCPIEVDRPRRVPPMEDAATVEATGRRRPGAPARSTASRQSTQLRRRMAMNIVDLCVVSRRPRSDDETTSGCGEEELSPSTWRCSWRSSFRPDCRSTRRADKRGSGSADGTLSSRPARDEQRLGSAGGCVQRHPLRVAQPATPSRADCCRDRHAGPWHRCQSRDLLARQRDGASTVAVPGCRGADAGAAAPAARRRTRRLQQDHLVVSQIRRPP